MIHHMILNLAVQHEVSALIGWPATIASLIVVIYAGSWLVWRYVEEPARHWIVGRFPARPASLPAGQAEERRAPSPPRDAGPPLPA
jgi:peptidoglycan/LPS O-acetylase OafA/YrhL